jgi:predicted RND superfamily exporter protein
MQRRLLFLIGILLVTLFFVCELTKLQVYTSFGDLLPQKHPYIKVHNRIRHLFGGANQVLIMVQAKKGDIFNTKTLEKVQWITRELEKLPGVDPYKIRSISSSKMKDFKFSAGTTVITPLMFPDIPKNDKEMDELRGKIYSNTRYYGPFVSYDSKKTLILADFFEESIDYFAIFNALTKIREHTEDDNHIISIAGEPMHLGFIKYHSSQVLMILAITVLAIVVMLYLYYRSKRAMFVPIMSAGTSAIWGLGFMALLGYNLDPLTLVLPFLISLMTARHSMQFMSRYMEEYANTRDVKQASQNIIEAMFIPGLTSILTDALGIALVAIATIPVLVKIAIACTFWSVATVILSMLFTPLVLSYIPESKQFMEEAQKRREGGSADGMLDYRDKFLRMLGRWIPQRGRWYIVIVSIVLSIVSFYYANQVIIGDFIPGSSILWPWHRYNKDAFRITFSMPLLNPLYIIVEGEKGNFEITQGPTLREMDKFQRYLAKHDRVMFVNSMVNSLPAFLMASYEDNPQWSHLPKEDKVLNFLARHMIYAGEPGTWDRYIDMKDKSANIIIYCRDKMPKTVESVINYINEYLKKTPGPPGGKYVLAGGAVGTQAAIRETIADAQIWNLILALGGVLLLVSLEFKSLTAGLILTIPLAMSNYFTFALMGAYHIGLTTNTFPVASVGIGLGVDYGIYFMGRLVEERKKGQDLSVAIYQAIITNGKSIIQIATTITIGLLLWVFSALKFQAEMGLLLAIILTLNMFGALLLVPAQICIIKPKFLDKQ